ncbi:single-stranded DNA-binding protein [soil metagenome]
MQQDNQITIFGNVGTTIDYRDVNGVPRAIFRMGSTPSVRDWAGGGWRDLETVWISVKVFRTLATNVSDSIKKGDPVVVTGRIRNDVWEDKSGEKRERFVLEASLVAHDLNRGATSFRRVDRTVTLAAPSPEDREVLDSLEKSAASAPAA